MNDKSESWGCLVAILFIGFGIAQIAAGYLGIEHHLGKIWAFIALVALFGFRFMLPITIGSFFGARDVWGWHWFWALIFAAPTLLLLVPGLLAGLISTVTNAFKK